MPSSASILKPPQSAHTERGDRFLREQVGDLVGLDAVVERADLVAELLRDVDHLRHLVGAIAVVLDEDVAAQHLGERLDAEVAVGRVPLVGSASQSSQRAPVALGLDPGLRGSRPRCPSASAGRPCRRRRASGSRRTPSSARTWRPGTSSPGRSRAGTTLSIDAAAADQVGRARAAPAAVVTPPARSRGNCGSCGQIECSAQTSAVFGFVDLVAVAGAPSARAPA